MSTDFEQFLTESVQTKKMTADHKAMFKANEDRIGQSALNSKGAEIKNSIVLDSSNLAYKDGNNLVIASGNEFDGEFSLIRIPAKAAAGLKKII